MIIPHGKIKNFISAGRLENNTFYLDKQLNRKDYQGVDEVLNRLGGEWSKKAGGHVFLKDPSEKLKNYLENDILPEKNPYAFFATPQQLARDIISKFSLFPGMHVLEPSCGTGSLIEIILELEPKARITAFEIDDDMFDILSEKFPEITIIHENFLTFDFEANFQDKLFDLIAMNPPFSTKDNKTSYIDHIQKAHSLLDFPGNLFAIMPQGVLYNSTKKIKEFREWCYNVGAIEKIDPGAFKESGTLVSTSLLSIEHISLTRNITQFTERVNGYLNIFVNEIELVKDSTYEYNQESTEICKLINTLNHNTLEVHEKIHTLYNKIIDECRSLGQHMPWQDAWWQEIYDYYIMEAKEYYE